MSVSLYVELELLTSACYVMDILAVVSCMISSMTSCDKAVKALVLETLFIL